MRLGPMLLAFFLLPACSLARAPIVDRDGGMLDAGFDASFDAGPIDVPEGFDTPPDTGFDAPVDGGFDAPVDTGVDAPVDTGVDAGMPDTGVDAPRTLCDSSFAAVPGHIDCPGASPGLCRFFADPTDSSTSCSDLCALVVGGTCVSVSDNSGASCTPAGGAIAGGCMRDFDDMLCLCTL